jgi:hypothetical protein
VCEVIFVTKTESFKEKFASLDQVAERAKSITGLLAYRCFQVYGHKRKPKKDRKFEKESRNGDAE